MGLRECVGEFVKKKTSKGGRKNWLKRLFNKGQPRTEKGKTERRSAAKAYARRMLLYDTTMAKRYEKAPSYVKEQSDREAGRGRTMNSLIGVDMKAVKRYERLTGRKLTNATRRRRVTGKASSDASTGTARRATGRVTGSFGLNAGYRRSYH